MADLDRIEKRKLKKEKYRESFFKTSKKINEDAEKKKEDRRVQALSRVRYDLEQHRIKGQQEYRNGLKEIDERIQLSK